MKIAVYGTGPIGSAFAFHLAKAGHDVTCIARGPRLAQLRADGAIVTATGERTAITPAETLDPAIAFDLVIVTVLAHKVDAIVPALRASIARSVMFTFNQFDPLTRLSSAVGAERCTFGFPAIVASLEDGRLRHTIYTVGQKTIAMEPRWAELLTKAGIATDVEPQMQSWLRTHAVLIAVLMAMAVKAHQRGAGLTISESRLHARALREGLRLVVQLGDRVRPSMIHALRALPLTMVLWVLSRTPLVKTIGSIGADEPRALLDVMLASTPTPPPSLRAIRP